MKALTYEGPRNIVYREVPDPVITSDDQAIIAVRLSGICGSDLHIWNGHGFSDETGYCVGHEAVGNVVELGADKAAVAERR